MPGNQGLQTSAKLAHEPTRNFDLETEFGLRIDVRDGKFKVRISSDFEEASPVGSPGEAPARSRVYELSPVVEDASTMWLAEATTKSGLVHLNASELESRYSKEFTDAVLEWEETGREYQRRGNPCSHKASNKQKPVRDSQWNSWVFQGGMLACWLAIQDDVLEVKHDLWGKEEGTFTWENAEDELQRFLKGYPWAQDESQAE